MRMCLCLGASSLSVPLPYMFWISTMDRLVYLIVYVQPISTTSSRHVPYTPYLC